MTHTDRIVLVAEAVQAVIENNKLALGLDSVYYGNQQNIPEGLSVSVAPASKRRELVGVQGPGGRTDNTFLVLIRVFNSRSGDEGTQRKFVDNLAEEIEETLHSDTTLGEIIIHGFIEEMQHGDIHKDNINFRVVQMIYRARTRTMI